MEREVVGQAGSLESCDALVLVVLSPGKNEIVLEMDGPSLTSFATAMESAVKKTLLSLGVTEGVVKVRDRGALDCTLRARVETAARRALEELRRIEEEE